MPGPQNCSDPGKTTSLPTGSVLDLGKQLHIKCKHCLPLGTSPLRALKTTQLGAPDAQPLSTEGNGDPLGGICSLRLLSGLKQWPNASVQFFITDKIKTGGGTGRRGDI